jgi:hypothetical protein
MTFKISGAWFCCSLSVTHTKDHEAQSAPRLSFHTFTLPRPRINGAGASPLYVPVCPYFGDLPDDDLAMTKLTQGHFMDPARHLMDP